MHTEMTSLKSNAHDCSVFSVNDTAVCCDMDDCTVLKNPASVELNCENDVQDCEWTPLGIFDPEFLDHVLDQPSDQLEPNFFNWWVSDKLSQDVIDKVILSHKVIKSGLPNRYGYRIPLHTNWNLSLMQSLLAEYDDLEVIEWLRYGFPIS